MIYRTSDGELVAIDKVRDEAARCCDETAKQERGERPPLRYGNPLTAEFSDAAFGVASEVALIVGAAFKRAGVKFRPAMCWEMAANLLREGWQRGHRLEPHVIGKKSN